MQKISREIRAMIAFFIKNLPLLGLCRNNGEDCNTFVTF
nr:MAG TPA: hypothetical protein [Caudoviricetes sp.]